jgi:hypothetical protein
MLLSRPAVALLERRDDPRADELRGVLRVDDREVEDELRDDPRVDEDLRGLELREVELRDDDARVDPLRFEPLPLLELFLPLLPFAAISLSFASLDACTISPRRLQRSGFTHFWSCAGGLGANKLRRFN